MTRQGGSFDSYLQVSRLSTIAGKSLNISLELVGQVNLIKIIVVNINLKIVRS